MPAKKPSRPTPTPLARNHPERDVVAIGNILRRVEARKKIQEKVLRELHSRGTINEIALRRAAIKEIGRHEDYGRNLPYYSEIHLALKKFGGHLGNQPVLHLASSTGISF
jgi:cellulose biosynthesis protein BcsQ